MEVKKIIKLNIRGPRKVFTCPLSFTSSFTAQRLFLLPVDTNHVHLVQVVVEQLDYLLELHISVKEIRKQVELHVATAVEHYRVH